MKKHPKKLIGICIILIALVLYLIPVDATFSIQTTSKGISLENLCQANKNNTTITAHPFLSNLTVNADKLYLKTSLFKISQVNNNILSKSKNANILTSKTIAQSYYHIKNKKCRIAPIVLNCQPNTNNAKLLLKYENTSDKKQNILTMELPAGKANIDMSARNVSLMLHDSTIKHGEQQATTNGNRVTVQGDPSKLNIYLYGDKPTVKIHSCKGKNYKLEFDDITSLHEKTIKIIDLDPSKLKISFNGKDRATKSDNWPTNAQIVIELGNLERKELTISEKGIQVTLSGECSDIKIAGIEKLERTALDVVVKFIEKIPDTIKDRLKN